MDHFRPLWDTYCLLAGGRIESASRNGERSSTDVGGGRMRSRRRAKRKSVLLFLFGLILVAASTASAQGTNTPPTTLPDTYSTAVEYVSGSVVGGVLVP